MVSLTYAYGQVLQWNWNAVGQRSRLIHPGGARTTYSYDANQRMTSLVNPQSQRTTWAYDANGQVVLKSVGNLVTTYVYDPAGRTTAIGAGTFGSLFAYRYDAAGRKQTCIEDSGIRTTWSYDPAGQLRTERANISGFSRTSYTYDPAGNLLLKTVDDDDSFSYTYNAANQQLSNGVYSYTYDLAGNRRSMIDSNDNITTYTYDALNHNIAFESPLGAVVTYTWAPVNKANDERQIERDDGAEIVRYVWDDQSILEEVDEFGIVVAENTVQPGGYGKLISRREDDVTNRYLFDDLGSTRSLFDNSGPADEYRYEAFGRQISSTGSTENPYTWVGEQGYRQDEETGLANLRARDYDPQAARFTSEDPLGLAAGDSNFYRYVTNDPINRTDPSGLDESARVVTAPPEIIGGSKLVVVEGAKNPELNGFVGQLIHRDSQEVVVRTVDLPFGIGMQDQLCVLRKQVELAVRSGSVIKSSDWNAWFLKNGQPCTGFKTPVAAFGKSSPVNAGSQSSTCTAPNKTDQSIKDCLEKAYKELGVKSVEDLLDVSDSKIASRLFDNGDCCPIFHSKDFAGRLCRIKVDSGCKPIYLWLLYTSPGFFTGGKLQIVGQGDGSAEEISRVCNEFFNLNSKQVCENFKNRIPIYGIYNQASQNQWGGAIFSAIGDATLVLGVGAYFKTASLSGVFLRAAHAVSLAGGTAHAGRGLYQLLKGNYDAAAADALAAILYLWQSKRCSSECRPPTARGAINPRPNAIGGNTPNKPIDIPLEKVTPTKWEDFLREAQQRLAETVRNFPSASGMQMSAAAPIPKGPISIDQALDLSAHHLGGNPTKIITSGSGGIQFIREFTLPNGDRMTLIARFDINPSSRHVQMLGPHLNLETQINGKTQNCGVLKDPHLPIDPQSIRPGDY